MTFRSALALGAFCFMAPLAFAQTATLSSSDIEQRLTASGYKVVEIERYDRMFEVRALDQSGICVELHLNPTSGEIIHRESDDRCNGRSSGRHGGRGEDDHGRHGGRHD